MKETIKLEEIEGFDELTEDEKEYFRVMQGEAEFRMSTYCYSGKFEMIMGIIIWTIYIAYDIFCKGVDVCTFYAAILIVVEVIYLIELCLDK